MAGIAKKYVIIISKYKIFKSVLKIYENGYCDFASVDSDFIVSYNKITQ